MSMVHVNRIGSLALVIAISLGAAMCKGTKEKATNDSSPAAPVATTQKDGSSQTPVIQPSTSHLTAEALKNGEYQSDFAETTTIKMTNGTYHEEGQPGGATELVITLHPKTAFGDLNGDGMGDAAVVLVSVPGGSGTFYDLAAVINQDGTPKHVATQPLGDRIKLQALSIESGIITVDTVTHGPDDPMCCPTQQVRQSFKFLENKLVKVSPPPDT